MQVFAGRDRFERTASHEPWAVMFPPEFVAVGGGQRGQGTLSTCCVPRLGFGVLDCFVLRFFVFFPISDEISVLLVLMSVLN